MKILSRIAFVIVAFLGFVLIASAGAEWEVVKIQTYLGNWGPLVVATEQLMGGGICLLIAWFGILSTRRY